MLQAVDCDLYLYADDSCLIYRGEEIKNIELSPNKILNNLCERYVENKLSIHFGEGKTKLR